MAAPWRAIPCKVNHLRLDIVLASGQSFRWRQSEDSVWTGVFKGKVWTLKQDDLNIYYQVYEYDSCSKTRKAIKLEPSQDSNDVILRDYFQLDVDVLKLYNKWAEHDPYFKKIASDFSGIRALRQDPIENLFSFICSSNNNISRITGMVEKLCTMYGEKVAKVDGTQYYSFPSVGSLAGPKVEEQLRKQGFGYRAKYIYQSAKMIVDKGVEWLYNLKNVDYEQARQDLMELPGVGAKVADCVCLMSLDKTSAIPVDTHVWQVTAKYYIPNLSKTKSLTDKLYKQIGDYYRHKFGDYAGWAQFVLFSADLKKFQNLQQEVQTLPQKRPSSTTESKPDKTAKKKKS
ncbi:N-glycosylase/DNA lyase [Exaiptasia diaphana]|uniref:N-glycosylase/DNA lyase n=1 Tax=Exaiptasia diaphana TaxID=2652724 RepID=A0A913XQ23_EXADI|nr:N-glycosylase/DNA lyase [Exaiptasia diaphana]KXJ25101.1 N-glycosylase/DNA lyase [Exaiptasia diaphana]